jgi:diguanylate cyclase (GGDEF)-like protein
MLWQGWWIVALAMLAGLNVSLISLYSATPLYRASARFIVSPSPSLTSSQVVSSLTALDKRSVISTYSEVLDSDRVFSETAETLQIPGDILKHYSRTAVVLPDASVVELSVSGPDPQLAALLANSIGQRAIDFSKGLNQIFDINFLDRAGAPGKPFSPQPTRDISLALGLGALAGCVLAILREQLRIPLDTLLRRTMIDGASSAYTRRYFERALDDELARNKAGHLALGLIRLYGLQDLIETLPPVVAQKLLHQITKVLQNELRGNDSIGRWDDVSFAVLLPATPGIAATRTLERIRQALSKTLEVEQIDFDLEPHIGVAVYQHNWSAKMLIEQADSALEQARQNDSIPVRHNENLSTASG